MNCSAPRMADTTILGGTDMEKKNRRKLKLGMAAVFVMTLVMGMTADAAGKNIGDYFSVQIGTWALKKGTAVRKGYTTSLIIPSQFAGGTLTFTAEAVADSDWQLSTVEAVAEIY